ncbi:MAG: DUF2341 domain-containing protein, partial [Candidatus Hodarchaeota archaeon]
VAASWVTSLSLGQWYHVVGVHDAGADTLTLFVNGVQRAQNTGATVTPDTGNAPLRIADVNVDFYTNEFNGQIDEVRVSNTVRSANWIQTEYNNQYDSGTFYSVDAEEKYTDTIDWHYPGLKYIFRKEITIDSTKVSGSSLSNFPVLIDLEDSDLHDPHNVRPDGDDILFCDATGAKLDHEIELFDQVGNGTHAHLVAWVRIPALSGSNDTQIFMYFGYPAASSQESPTNVWDRNYVSVWHLNEATGGSNAIKDSTANDNDGTDYNSPTFGQTGKISSAIEFDGTNQYIELPNSATLENITEGDYTYEVWFYADQVPPGTDPSANDKRYAAFIKNDPHGGIYYDHDMTFTIEHWLDGPTQTVAISNTYDPQSYYHLVGVVSKTDGYTKLYVNGNLENTDTWTAGTDAWDYYTKTLKIGIANPGAAIYRWCLDGKLDEMRVSDTTRSADWISTEYNNQNDPDTFYSVKSIEIQGNWTMPYLRYKKEITIDNAVVSGSNDQSNFPFLIDIYDTDLHVTDKVQADGDDIAFIDANGMRISHEIEEFNQNFNTTHAHLIVWVKIPVLSKTTDTVIYMRYGNSAVTSLENPEELWDDYNGVWHFDESSGDALDSTVYDNNGVITGAMQQATGQIDGSLNFDGINDYVSFADSTSLDVTSAITLGAWINGDGNWWNSKYQYRKQITITNNYGATVVTNTIVKFIENTGILISNNKLRIDEKDWRVVYWNGASWIELARDVYDGWNTATTETWFRLQADISNGNSDSNYFVYYGSASETGTPPTLGLSEGVIAQQTQGGDNPFNSAIDLEDDVEWGAAQAYTYSPSSTNWYVVTKISWYCNQKTGSGSQQFTGLIFDNLNDHEGGEITNGKGDTFTCNSIVSGAYNNATFSLPYPQPKRGVTYYMAICPDGSRAASGEHFRWDYKNNLGDGAYNVPRTANWNQDWMGT